MRTRDGITTKTITNIRKNSLIPNLPLRKKQHVPKLLSWLKRTKLCPYTYIAVYLN